MTHEYKTIQVGKCLMLLALAMTILSSAVQLQAEVQKKAFKLYPNPPFASCFGSNAKKSPLESVDAYDSITTIWVHGKAVLRENLAINSNR